ncbi:MAG TPA: M1 family aminopeptidase [Acidimicrobiales bacterium]
MVDAAAYRLPLSAKPERYELELVPDLEASRFEGRETVIVTVVEPTTKFVLNSVDLDIRDVRIEHPSGRSLVGTVTYNEPEQQATFSFSEELEPAKGYRLSLSFGGKLNEKLQGFYRSTFTDRDGAQGVIASTQFEPTDARRAFPCWDEPAFKAVFSVTLVVPDKLVALSNSREISRSDESGGRTRIKFADTIPMSTYLVAYAVGPFEISSEREVDGVELRIAAVPGKSSLTAYASKVGEHALRFLAAYFDIPYPGDKLDHIAIPDFSFGAMENLGCVTYRESALLTNPATASQLELQRVATVIAHETAHMWFGDLVTMKWWNGIWLNEAFATFMELLTTDDLRPEWDVWTAFSTGKSAAMVTDGLRATRPIEFPVGRPEEAEAMFDLLTYQKGGAVLRMLEQYLGPEAFRKGIGHYLRSHAFGNTETGDLWDALETTSGEPVRSIMDSWIWQGGHPVVTVEQTGPAELSLHQRRFLYDGSESDERWVVPVNLRSSVEGQVQRQRVLLDGESVTVSFDGPIDWVLVNDGAWGFYRAHYSPQLSRRLDDAGVLSVCSPMERFGLLTDAFAAVVAGIADTREWASVARSMRGDDDPDVWAAIVGVTGLLSEIGGDDDKQAVQSFVRELAEPVWRELGWDPGSDETPRTATARGRVLSALGLVGSDPEVIAEATSRFDRHLEGVGALSPDVVSAALRIVVAEGGVREWEAVLNRYREVDNPQEKLRYLYALAETRDPELVSRTLDLTLGTEVRAQDGPFLVAGVLGRPDSGAQAWAWVVRHWDELTVRFPNPLLLRVFESLAAQADAQVAASVHEFCSTHELPIAGPRLDQILERLDINVAMAARMRGTLRAAFAP